MSSPYPRKYWWVVLIVVPIAVGLIAIVPGFLSDSDGDGNRITIEDSNVGGNVQIIGTQVILNQLKKGASDVGDMKDLEDRINRAVNLAQGGFYKDAIPLFEEIANKAQAPAVYNNLGLLYLLENRNERAREAFKQGLAIDPAYQPLRLNLARLYEKEGRITESMDQLEKAPDEPEAKTLLTKLRDKAAAGLFEHEPNDDILSPNDTPLGKKILGAISAPSDVDVFKFTMLGPPRDILAVEVKNLSTGLKLRVALSGPDKSRLWAGPPSYDVTPGQDILHAFSALPNTTYYLSVGSYSGQGKYELSLSPQRAFDSYEPNDDILTAKDTEFSNPIKASLMDKSDRDYYRIRSPGNAVSVSLRNSSPGLQPWLQIWRSDKSRLWGGPPSYQVTPGQDIETSFATKAGGIYYVSVASFGGSGEYTLTLVQSE